MSKISIILLAAVVFGIFFCGVTEASRIYDKKLAPENVAIVNNGIRYIPNSVYDPQKGREYYIEAWDDKTRVKLWEQKIYEILYDLNMEQDVQDRDITDLHVVDGKLMIANENNDEYVLDLDTKEVMKITAPKSNE